MTFDTLTSIILIIGGLSLAAIIFVISEYIQDDEKNRPQ
jgi:hypothetical protein